MVDEARRWNRVKQVLQDALERPVEERERFLRSACGDDGELRSEVESLLRAHAAAGGFVQGPAIEVLAPSAAGARRDGTWAEHRLQRGGRLGHYELRSAIGKGGMGEVWKAHDTTLHREVAIKMLPEELAQDSDRLARLDREATLLASLNHPNIAAIYGLEEHQGTRFLVLELVEGRTLAERLERGPIPVEESLKLALQIAEALEAAHERGVIHRDLKPANIKITPDGRAKVLDFGLAKALAPASEGDPVPASISTEVGVILGTPAYMSPEQARGQAVDKRTDIWSFGCVMYETLTSVRPFRGDTTSDTIAAVFDREPDWHALPAETAASIRKLLRRCLEKDRKRRLADIADARFELEEALTRSSADPGAVDRINPTDPARIAVRALPWTVAAAAVAITVAVYMLSTRWPNSQSAAPLRLSVDLGAEASLVTDQGTAAVLSPDGTVLAFVAKKSAGGNSQLYIRRLEQLQATALPGTDAARNPFFSPDGQSIAFFAGGKLKKISVTGGDAVTISDALNGLGGGTWTSDGTITFSPNATSGASLWRVSSAGGKPELLTTVTELEGETIHRWPQVLPGGKAILYTSQAGRFASANIVVQPLPKGQRKVLLRGGYYGRYVPSGHLIYLHEGTLFAAVFDLDRLELVGQPVPVLEGVANDLVSGAQFAVADSGTLVYLPRQAVSDDIPISWMDRTGKTTRLRATLANWSNPSFAPDGHRLAMDISDGKQVNVWIYDWTRDALARLTFDPSDDREPVWTPDGRRIVFGSTRDTKSAFNLYWQRSDGAGEAQRLTDSKTSQYPASWHSSGKFLMFVEASPQTGNDLMILPMEGNERSIGKPGKPYAFLNTPASETYPMFSPDGRWVAYASDESSHNELYVRPFPDTGGKWQISTEGAAAGGIVPLLHPTWSRTRNELFYSTPDGRIMVVPYTVDDDVFAAEKPRLWSPARFMRRPRQVNIDLHPDGDRFAVAAVPEAQTMAKLDKVVFIFNFFDDLRRIAPIAKR